MSEYTTRIKYEVATKKFCISLFIFMSCTKIYLLKAPQKRPIIILEVVTLREKSLKWTVFRQKIKSKAIPINNDIFNVRPIKFSYFFFHKFYEHLNGLQ